MNDVRWLPVRGKRLFSILLGMTFVCVTASIILGLAATSARARFQEQGEKKFANEIVMVPGMEITAKNEIGKVAIIAGPDLQRTYRWEDCEGTVNMLRRPTRWYGSLGIYYPGPGNHWKECGGITRAVVQECWWHFDSVEAALKGIREANTGYNLYNRNEKPVQYYVYTDDGLVVMWSKTPERKQLTVEVRQVLIDGRKPTQMLGSNNDAIAIRYHKLDGMAGDDGGEG